VGPFGVEEADPDRLVSVAAMLARLPQDALERVPAGIRGKVLALEEEAGAAAPLPAGRARGGGPS
jgi:hypothetical protein